MYTLFMRYEDLTGQKFGAWTVIKRMPSSKSGATKWLCKCDCGSEKEVFASNLKRGLTVSCGCKKNEMQSEKAKTHGMTNTRIYRLYRNIKNRCYNTKKDNYKWYGGQGIKMCDEWRDSFECFYKWAKENGYTDNLTLDRIDSKGNYEPSNCRWITIREQQNNRRDNVIITYKGKTQTLPKWAEEVGINYITLWNRIFKNKWDIEKAFTEKVGKKTHNGIYKGTLKNADIKGGRKCLL